MKQSIFVVIFLSPFLLFAQQKKQASRFTISGYVKDAQSGETLIGASINVVNQTKGISSNQYGFYSITLDKGNYELAVSYVGYQAKITPIELTTDLKINFDLVTKGALAEVIVSTKKRDANVKNAQMGKFSLSVEQVRSVPALMGEVDVLKTIQLLPGVRNAGEGSSGIYVRGGGPDQNLIMLDDAIVYNTGHLFGFFSIFNADAIKNVSLIKGGMPAQYGGRLSSVLDVQMKEGNDKKFQVDGGLGLIASRLSIQGPIKKNKSSFIISARRTYIDALTKPFMSKSSSFSGSGYFFYDVNAKVNYRFSEKDRLYLSGYFGRDVFDFVNGKRSLDFKVPWGNATGTLRWNHVYNKKLFGNTTAVFNNYNFAFNAKQNNFAVKLASGIRDYTLKEDFDLYPFTGHKVKFGGLYTYHKFTPSVITGRQDSIIFKPKNSQLKFAHEAAVYFQDDWEINQKITVNMGLRYSWFQQVGPYTIYQTYPNSSYVDTIVFKGGEKIKSYGGLEPRFTARYSINDETSVKASISRNYQYIHLVSNAGSTLPTDLWVPSTYKVKPQISWLYAAGLFRNFKDNMYESSIELYYKSMENQIEYEKGYIPNTLEDTEKFFTFGKGWSYGAELFFNKTKGRLTGWIGYTLSWTWRKFDNLNDGMKYPAKYDRRNDLSIVAMYNLNKRWKLSASFVYGSGNAATLPQRFYVIDNILSQEYSRINEYRLPSYHRLDFSAINSPKKNERRKKLKTEWVFSVYNVYSRQNPYFIYYDQTIVAPLNAVKIQAKQVSLFPIIPSVTWNFKF